MIGHRVRRAATLPFWGAVVAITCGLLGRPTPAEEPAPQQVIAAAARKVVKLYGAGGLRGLEAYQSGILVSPDGRILTAASTVLDSDQIDCVLDDGRRYEARLVGIDPRRELAVLQIEAADLPCFTLSDAAEPARARGSWRSPTCSAWPLATNGPPSNAGS
jgi:S1-C subfamily serine protease